MSTPDDLPAKVDAEEVEAKSQDGMRITHFLGSLVTLKFWIVQAERRRGRGIAGGLG
jgi:hypothetical protein